MSDASDLAAVGHAQSLGCELSYREYGIEKRPVYSWRHGLRSSADQYCMTFSRVADAARHFLSSREGIQARRMAILKGTATEAFIDLPPATR